MPHRNSLRLRLALTASVAAYFVVCCRWPSWMDLMGIGLIKGWFIDLRAVLAVSDAHLLGLHPDAHNPLDLFHQPNTYTGFWYGLGSLHLTRDDTVWLGATLGFAFLIVVLLQMRVRTRGETALGAFVLASPPIVFAFNRGNVDLLLVVLFSALVPCLVSRHTAVRWLALGIVLLGAAMKFYPAVAAIALLAPTRSRRERVAQLLVLTGALAVFGILEAHNLARYASSQMPDGLHTFGAGVTMQLLHVTGGVSSLLTAVFGFVAVAVWWKIAPRLEVPPEHRRDHLQLVVGATVLTGCYFLTFNYAYRLVFAIGMIPFLWTAAKSTAMGVSLRRLSSATLGLLLVWMWGDALFCLGVNLSHRLTMKDVEVWSDRFLLAEQPLVAACIIALLGFVVPFVRDGLADLAASQRPVGATAADAGPVAP